MRAKPLKILATAALTLIALTAIVAFAGFITLSDYKEATGNYVKAWAYVEGKTYLCPDYSGTIGRLWDVKGKGGYYQIVPLPAGSVVKSTSYTVHVFDPNGDWAFHRITVEVYGPGIYEIVSAEAFIKAYRGTCAPLSRESP
ncbi:MAG: hypothetical protein P3X22_007860 [Thermoprotei archaeon]|nr:hypothetical protein [Thermoprotei archaeon]